MPEYVDLKELGIADLEQESINALLGQLEDQKALTLVINTLSEYENSRKANQEPRWLRANELISGYKAPVNWTNTKIPRANHSTRLAYNKVEEALPIIIQSIFTADGEWFDIEAEPGASPEEAEQMRARLSYILDHNDDVSGISARSELCEAVKSILTYGNGGVFLEWDSLKNKPIVSFAPLEDIYVDPGNRTHSIDGSRSVIRRDLKTIGEIQLWRESPGMKIPSDNELFTLSNTLFHTSGDEVRDQKNALYGEMSSMVYNVMAANPAERKIEVLYYYSKTQIIVILGRKYVAFSSINPYGFLPFAFAHYSTSVGRFYSDGIADVLAGEQRIQESIINKYTDQMALALSPPLARKPSTSRTLGATRWAPGATYETGNPKDDVITLGANLPVADIWSAMDYFENLSDKRVGRPLPTTSGNGVRTAGGVQTQVQGGLSRIYMVTKQVEDFLIIPLLCKLQKMMMVHEQPGTVAIGRSKGKQSFVDTNVYYKNYNYKVRAASNMLTKEKLLPLLPTVFQSLGNGPLVQGLAATGQVVNWPEVFRFFKEATGLGEEFNFTRQMTQEEFQKMNQPSPEVQAEAQKAQMEQQTAMQVQQMKSQTELQKEQIKKQPDPMALQMEQMKMQFEQQKAEMDLYMKQKDLEFKEREAQLKMQIKQVEANFKIQTQAKQAEFESARMENDFVMQARQSELDRERSEVEHESSLRMNEEKERNMVESNRIKLQAQKQRAAQKPEKAEKE